MKESICEVHVVHGRVLLKEWLSSYTGAGAGNDWGLRK